MTTKFRESEFIDFNTGTVKLAPIQLLFRQRMAGNPQPSDLVRLFHCRVEVWQLGVAAQIVNSIEYNTPPSIWSHAAYSLVALLVNHLETVGNILNPDTDTNSPASAIPTGADFERGFRDIYGDVTTSSGEKLNPLDFYTRARKGLFALGSTPNGLWVHKERSISTQDFDIVHKNPADPATRKYYINPHSTVRTVIDHFPTVIAQLNDPAAQFDPMRARLKSFMHDE